MKSKSTRTLHIITSIGAVVFFALLTMSLFYGDLSFSNLDDYLSLALLLIFIAGFALSWMNKKIAGIIFMIWNAAVWIYDLHLFREMDYSMASAMASPFMVIGAFFLLEWYKTSMATMPSKQQQWKFILRVLLINYVVLYPIIVFSELFHGEAVDYLSFPFILFPLLLLIFVVGFLLSWKREILSGYLFLFWSAILIFGTFAYTEIMQLGLWVVFGLPILLQGMFYIKTHNEFKPN